MELKLPVANYRLPEYKDYFRDKYNIENEAKLTEGLCQVLYALEWYNIPKDDLASLVRYHPYLTK